MTTIYGENEESAIIILNKKIKEFENANNEWANEYKKLDSEMRIKERKISSLLERITELQSKVINSQETSISSQATSIRLQEKIKVIEEKMKQAEEETKKEKKIYKSVIYKPVEEE